MLKSFLLFVAVLGAQPPERDGGIIQNQASPFAKLQSTHLSAVQWQGGFWDDQFTKTGAVTLPRLWELAEPWAWHNLRVAAGREKGDAKGCFWQDAWIYKWIESACYLYSQNRDPRLLAEMDRIIDLIAAAQQPDGYLATQATLRKLKRFSFQHHHELYTMGHLLTAACIHRRITGKSNFLDVAQGVADYVHATYSAPDADPMLANCPVNPSIVMGAVELYRTTGQKRYLELANIIINNRGKKRGPIGRTNWGRMLGGTDLNQDRIPLRKANEVVGHAVFWSYLYAGAADTYMETGDQTLLSALERLWTDVTTKKMYITGGVSPVHKGLSNRSYQPGKRVIQNDEVHEAAGLPYDLPNATGYNETCGQIGNLMWNWRMLAISGDARYADIMERSLYNAILSGIGLDGKRWTYTNPLRWYGGAHELLSNDFHTRFDPGEKHICCPTNLMRTIASWHGYLYGVCDGQLWIHHYGANHARIELPNGDVVPLTVNTNYPWDGHIKIEVGELDRTAPFSLHMRIPYWSKNALISINGKPVTTNIEPSSYVALKRSWKAGDTVELNLPMPVRFMSSNPRVEQTRGQVAVARGPIVYCLESIDLPGAVSIDQIRLQRDAEWGVTHMPELLGGVTVLETDAVAMRSVDPDGPLYQELAPADGRKVHLRLIPYYAWNNRGEPQMTVWLPLD